MKYIYAINLLVHIEVTVLCEFRWENVDIGFKYEKSVLCHSLVT